MRRDFGAVLASLPAVPVACHPLGGEVQEPPLGAYRGESRGMPLAGGDFWVTGGVGINCCWTLTHAPSGARLFDATDGERLIAIAEDLLAQWPGLWPLACPWEHPDWPEAASYLRALSAAAGGRDLDYLEALEVTT